MKRLRLRMGLRWQLVLLFLLVSLIPLLIVAFWAHRAGTRGLTDAQSKRDLIEQAHDRVDLADGMIHRANCARLAGFDCAASARRVATDQ